MAGATYIALATTTLASAASTITIGSIPSGYRDLVLTIDPVGVSNVAIRLRFNSDTGSNYPAVRMYQNGSPQNDQQNNDHADVGFIQTDSTGLLVVNIFEYSVTNKHKTVLARWNNVRNADGWTGVNASSWANSNAINTIAVSASSGNLGTGTTISLFGIGA
jgi:hypothetical protein